MVILQLCSRLYSKTNRFDGLRSNVCASSVARWNARDGLHIRYNRSFFAVSEKSVEVGLSTNFRRKGTSLFVSQSTDGQTNRIMIALASAVINKKLC